MSAQAVEVKKVETFEPLKNSIWEEAEQMHDQIIKRAADIFSRNGGVFDRDLDNWLEAERELVWEPCVEFAEKENVYTIEAAVAGVDPKDLDIRVTAEDLLIQAETHHEHPETKGTIHKCDFSRGKLFKSIRFPRPIDPDKIKAECKNGLLKLTAPVAEPVKARTISIESA